MKEFAVTGEDSKPNSPVQKLMRGALGLPLELSAAPTTAGGELPNHGDNGWFGSLFYINLGGSTYSMPLTLT